MLFSSTNGPMSGTPNPPPKEKTHQSWPPLIFSFHSVDKIFHMTNVFQKLLCLVQVRWPRKRTQKNATFEFKRLKLEWRDQLSLGNQSKGWRLEEAGCVFVAQLGASGTVDGNQKFCSPVEVGSWNSHLQGDFTFEVGRQISELSTVWFGRGEFWSSPFTPPCFCRQRQSFGACLAKAECFSTLVGGVSNWFGI